MLTTEGASRWDFGLLLLVTHIVGDIRVWVHQSSPASVWQTDCKVDSRKGSLILRDATDLPSVLILKLPCSYAHEVYVILFI